VGWTCAGGTDELADGSGVERLTKPRTTGVRVEGRRSGASRRGDVGIIACETRA